MEDEWLDSYGDQDEYWNDAEQFELNQLALDREYDDPYDDDEEPDDGYGYDSDDFESAGQPPF